MKKGEIPEGIRFADEQSAANYQKALDGDYQAWGPCPVAISADGPGKGKTTLARIILTKRFGEPIVSDLPATTSQWCGLINRGGGHGYLFFEDVAGRDIGRLMALSEQGFLVVFTGNHLPVRTDSEGVLLRIDLI